MAVASSHKITYKSNIFYSDKKMTNMVDSMELELFHSNEVIEPANVGLDNPVGWANVRRRKGKKNQGPVLRVIFLECRICNWLYGDLHYVKRCVYV